MGSFNILTLTYRLGRYSERPSLSFFAPAKYLSRSNLHSRFAINSRRMTPADRR